MKIPETNQTSPLMTRYLWIFFILEVNEHFPLEVIGYFQFLPLPLKYFKEIFSFCFLLISLISPQKFHLSFYDMWFQYSKDYKNFYISSQKKRNLWDLLKSTFHGIWWTHFRPPLNDLYKNKTRIVNKTGVQKVCRYSFAVISGFKK